MDVKVEKIYINENSGSSESNYKKVGTASITIDNRIGIRDISIMDGDKGLWVSFPSRPKRDMQGNEKKDENGKTEFLDLVFPTTKESREQIVGLILEAYKKEKEKPEEK